LRHGANDIAIVAIVRSTGQRASAVRARAMPEIDAATD